MPCPFNFSRRSFLSGLAATAALSGPAAAANAQSSLAGSSFGSSKRSEGAADHASPSPRTEADAPLELPFHGEHQQGIVTPAQKYSEVVALDVQFTEKSRLEKLLRTCLLYTSPSPRDRG